MTIGESGSAGWLCAGVGGGPTGVVFSGWTTMAGGAIGSISTGGGVGVADWETGGVTTRGAGAGATARGAGVAVARDAGGGVTDAVEGIMVGAAAPSSGVGSIGGGIGVVVAASTTGAVARGTASRFDPTNHQPPTAITATAATATPA